MDDPERISSPDGTYAVLLFPMEMRMSHWLALPRIIEVAGNRTILDLTETMWSAETVRWSDDSSSVSLTMRRYPGDVPGVRVKFDVCAETAVITVSQDEMAMSLPELPLWLETHAARRH